MISMIRALFLHNTSERSLKAYSDVTESF